MPCRPLAKCDSDEVVVRMPERSGRRSPEPRGLGPRRRPPWARALAACSLVGLLAGSAGLLAEAPAAAATLGTFSTTGSLPTALTGATTTLLDNGSVLVAGGESASGQALAAAEVYSETTGTFSTTGSLATPRYDATATLLPSGKVLICGGITTSGTTQSVTGTAELYDPSTGTFSPAGSLATPRYDATATLLPNGDVLVADGVNRAVRPGDEHLQPDRLDGERAGLGDRHGARERRRPRRRRIGRYDRRARDRRALRPVDRHVLADRLDGDREDRRGGEPAARRRRPRRRRGERPRRRARLCGALRPLDGELLGDRLARHGARLGLGRALARRRRPRRRRRDDPRHPARDRRALRPVDRHLLADRLDGDRAVRRGDRGVRRRLRPRRRRCLERRADGERGALRRRRRAAARGEAERHLPRRRVLDGLALGDRAAHAGALGGRAAPGRAALQRHGRGRRHDQRCAGERDGRLVPDHRVRLERRGSRRERPARDRRRLLAGERLPDRHEIGDGLRLRGRLGDLEPHGQRRDPSDRGGGDDP